MKPLPLIRLSTFALALAALGPTTAWAQDPSHTDHIMVLPPDLKWADATSIPPGAKVAVIEGPANEAVPYILRIKFPADVPNSSAWLSELVSTRDRVGLTKSPNNSRIPEWESFVLRETAKQSGCDDALVDLKRRDEAALNLLPILSGALASRPAHSRSVRCQFAAKTCHKNRIFFVPERA